MTLTHSWRAEPVHPSPRASEQQPCSSHSEGCLCIQGIMLTRGRTATWPRQGVVKEVVFIHGKQDSKITIAV